MNQTLNQTSSYFETMLHQYAANTPCSQAIFAVNDDILLEYGSEIHSRNLMLQMVEKNNQKYDIYTYSIQKNKKIFRSIFLIPSGKTPMETEFKNLNDLILNYYMNLPQQVDYQFVDTYSIFLEKITEDITSHFTDKDEVGVVSHFHIQDLRNYFKNMSEQYTEEIHKQIKQGILRYLKKGDLLFRVNQRSYITYSHNCNVDTVKQRFSDIFFQLNTLIIRYQLSFHKLDSTNFKKREFWDNIVSGD